MAIFTKKYIQGIIYFFIAYFIFLQQIIGEGYGAQGKKFLNMDTPAYPTSISVVIAVIYLFVFCLNSNHMAHRLTGLLWMDHSTVDVLRQDLRNYRVSSQNIMCTTFYFQYISFHASNNPEL